MGVSIAEVEQVSKLTYEQAYNRIKEYYTDFINSWQRMSDAQKSSLTMGNGRQAPVEFINQSVDYVKNLSSIPTLLDTIEIAKSVIYKSLEYSFHDQDRFGIKMGAYSKYIFDTFKNGELL